MLPDAGLDGRANAAIVADGDGFIVAGGQGPVYEIRQDDVVVGRQRDDVVDGARYDRQEGTWTPLPAAPADADGLGLHAGTLFAPGEGVTYAYDPTTGTWGDAPADFHDGWFGAVTLGERAVQVTDPGMGNAVRLGGVLLDPEAGSVRLAEADTPARTGAAVAAVGDEAVFVWGGASAVPGEDPAGDHHRWYRVHEDGAVWRP